MSEDMSRYSELHDPEDDDEDEDDWDWGGMFNSGSDDPPEETPDFPDDD
jgi:hypothetical protein